MNNIEETATIAEEGRDGGMMSEDDYQRADYNEQLMINNQSVQ